MRGLILYLIIGLIFGLLIEVAWPFLMDEEELQIKHRLAAILAWPLIIIISIFNMTTNDDDEGTFTGC